MRIGRPIRAFSHAGLVISLGGLALTPVQASQPPAVQAQTADPIVVTGTRLSPEAMRERASEFVRRTVANGERPVARWVDRVCPNVIGLQDRYAQIVEAKIREIARAADIPVARGSCAPNIAVSFSAHADAVARTIAARAPQRMAEVPIEARDALLEGSAAVRWWYTTDTRGRDGMGVRTSAPPFVQGNGEGGGPFIPANIPAALRYRSSIVSTQTVRVLQTATVLVDIDRVEGMTLDAVASYVALVALAEINPAGFAPTGSILGLFEPPEGPLVLTDWDRTFLRALYDLPLDREARLQRGHLIGALVETQAEPEQ